MSQVYCNLTMTIQEHIKIKYGESAVQFESPIDFGTTNAEIWGDYYLHHFKGQKGENIIAYKKIGQMCRATIDLSNKTITVAMANTFDTLAIYSFVCENQTVGLTFESGTNLYFQPLYNALTKWRDFSRGFFWIEI